MDIVQARNRSILVVVYAPLVALQWRGRCGKHPHRKFYRELLHFQRSHHEGSSSSKWSRDQLLAIPLPFLQIKTAELGDVRIGQRTLIHDELSFRLFLCLLYRPLHKVDCFFRVPHAQNLEAFSVGFLVGFKEEFHLRNHPLCKDQISKFRGRLFGNGLADDAIVSHRLLEETLTEM
jgi:hypothetical protein